MKKDKSIMILPVWRGMKMLEERLGHEFTSHQLLELALTHSSWANDQQQSHNNNERLEFLGDAVLELCISQELFRRYPEAKEGMLTHMRSQLVNEKTLADLARKIGIQQVIKLGNGEEQQNGREKNSVLADTMEAVIAALYLDSGFEITQCLVSRLFTELWDTISQAPQEKDPKTLLQEICQKMFCRFPVYHHTGESGPSHEKMFCVTVRLPNGEEFTGEGRSQKKAEQTAAKNALVSLAQV